MSLKTYPSLEKGITVHSPNAIEKLCDYYDATQGWKLEHEKLYVCVLRKDLENSSFQPRCEVYADEAILDCDCGMKNRAVWEEYHKKLREFFEWLDTVKFPTKFALNFSEEYEEKKKSVLGSRNSDIDDSEEAKEERRRDDAELHKRGLD